MKTLILNGSPRANGDTASLVEKLAYALEGDSRIVNAYRCNISPCIDCRYCWENDGCRICDDMQENAIERFVILVLLILWRMMA